MAIKCPKCSTVLEVQLTAAPPMQADKAGGNDEVGRLLDQIEDGELNAWEADFIGKLRPRYEQYGAGVRMSDKQMEILRKIARGE